MAETHETNSTRPDQPGKATVRGKEAVHEAKEAGKDLGGAAADMGEERAEQGRERAYKSLDATADRLKDAGEDLRGADEKFAGELISRAATGLTGAADFLRNHQTSDLMHEVQDFGRKNPAAFLGLTAAAGFLLARVGHTAMKREQPASGSGATNGHAPADSNGRA